MTIKFVSRVKHLKFVDALKWCLSQLRFGLKHKHGKDISKTLTETTRDYLELRQPNSYHWKTEKVQPLNEKSDSGTIEIDIPGVNRTFKDLTIRPIRAKALTIPAHSSAIHKRAKDFPDLFKPKGKDYLALIRNMRLVVMFYLRRLVHQRQDRTLLPSDEKYGEDLSQSIIRFIDRDFINTLAKV